MSRIGIFCFFIVASMGAPFAVAADILIDDVPIPADVRVEVPLNVPETLSRFSGAWVGSWGDKLHHILIVENIPASGEASVAYAVGNEGVRAQWRRHEATVSGNMLTITIADAFNVTYVLTSADSLRATYRRGDIVAQATLSRVAFAELLPRAKAAWTTPSEFLNTTLQEGGKPIRLEVVIKKPSGGGPFLCSSSTMVRLVEGRSQGCSRQPK
jgi:hypothetical protein